MLPKYSIILPTYNRAHLLPMAIESVLAQSLQNWELLIIDDGSDDDTKKLIFSYRDPRILYYYQENQGRSKSRNIGLAGARGEWICFLDSDDWYLEDHLESFDNAMMDAPSAKIFRTGAIIKKEDGKEIKRSAFPDKGIEGVTFILTNYCTVLEFCIHVDIARASQFPNIASWEDKSYLVNIIKGHKWHQINLQTVTQLEHINRSIIHTYKDIQGINDTMLVMEQTLSDVTLRDKYLGPVQQNFLLSMMVNATEVGVGIPELMQILKEVKKNVMPMTWIRYWKIRILG